MTTRCDVFSICCCSCRFYVGGLLWEVCRAKFPLPNRLSIFLNHHNNESFQKYSLPLLTNQCSSSSSSSPRLLWDHLRRFFLLPIPYIPQYSFPLPTLLVLTQPNLCLLRPALLLPNFLPWFPLPHPHLFRSLLLLFLYPPACH